MKPSGNGAAPPLLGRDAILAAEDLTSAEVDIEAWGGRVRVRALSGAERLAYERRCEKLSKDGKRDADGNMDAIVLLVIAAAVDLDGQAIFTEADLPALKGKNFEAVTAVFEKAMVLNGMRAEDLEELAGN